jgi:hypothetical protein
MKVKMTICAAMCGSFLALVASSTNAQILYSENFDDGQASTRWTAHAGIGYSDTSTPVNALVPMDTNFDTMPFSPTVDGVNDDFSGFAFDYSAAGIPSAPGSAGGSTIGMKLYSNLFSNDLGGFSVNPNNNLVDLDGDYSVSFYSWSSTVGGTAGFPAGGSGSTMLSHWGIMTTGSKSETLLATDGIFFAYTGEGGSASDYRAYSIEQKDSYDGVEANGIYHAGGATPRSGNNQLYIDAVGGATTVPQSVKDAFPTQNFEGTLNAGSAAFRWQHNEIKKIGDNVEWYLNGFKLITVELSNFSQANQDAMGGNISFGHSDINYASSTDGLAPDLLFTLIDNIVVTEIVTVVENANFDGDDDVDGRDFLTWQRGFGINDGTALLSDGDANGDGNVDGDDLIVWQAQYGEPIPPLSAVTSVPEPASVSLFGALLAFFGLRRPAFGFARSR